MKMVSTLRWGYRIKQVKHILGEGDLTVKHLSYLACVGLLSGCLSMVPNDMQIIGYEQVNTPAEFWVRAYENDRATGPDFAPLPDAFKNCFGEEMVKLAPPSLSGAVDQFIRDKNVGNYELVVNAVEAFANNFEDTYGIKPGEQAGQNCLKRIS